MHTHTHTHTHTDTQKKNLKTKYSLFPWKSSVYSPNPYFWITSLSWLFSICRTQQGRNVEFSEFKYWVNSHWSAIHFSGLVKFALKPSANSPAPIFFYSIELITNTEAFSLFMHFVRSAICFCFIKYPTKLQVIRVSTWGSICVANEV